MLLQGFEPQIEESRDPASALVAEAYDPAALVFVKRL
jgi:hypothetical protein